MSKECYICNSNLHLEDYYTVGHDPQFGFKGHDVCERCYHIHNLDVERHGMTVVEEIADKIAYQKIREKNVRIAQ